MRIIKILMVYCLMQICSYTLQNVETTPGTNEIEKHAKSFHDFLKQNKGKNSRTEGSLGVCRKMKEKLAAGRLDYNLFTECSQRLLRTITEVKEKIKELEANMKAKKEESEKKIERFQTTNKKIMADIKKLKEDIEKLGEDKKNIGVKLLVRYNSQYLSPASRPEIEQKGGKDSYSFIKCHVRGICPGFSSFEKLRDVLERLLSGQRIRYFIQERGSIAGKEVAEFTSNDTYIFKKAVYCDIEGAVFSRKEVKTQWQWIGTGGRAFLCGGGRRTILALPSPL